MSLAYCFKITLLFETTQYPKKGLSFLHIGTGPSDRFQVSNLKKMFTRFLRHTALDFVFQNVLSAQCFLSICNQPTFSLHDSASAFSTGGFAVRVFEVFL